MYKQIVGYEIEKKCVEIFQNLGWETETCAHNMPYDFYLKINGVVTGYVECFCVLNPKMQEKVLKDKIQRIQRIIDKEKPAIFVLTNGEVFDVYYDGVFSATLSIPLSPKDFSCMRRLMTYYNNLQKGIKDE